MATMCLNILAIEDDPEAQANLCDVLELDGHHVQAVSSVHEALNLANWQDISAVILDRQLPDGSGDALLPRLRELAPDAAIIVVTGHADWEGTVSALRHGATDYILKPVDADALRATLTRVARLKEAEARARNAERLAAIGQMITAVSHESRNALHRVATLVEELTNELRDRLDLAPILENLRRAQDELQRIFEDLRCYAGPIHLEKVVCSLSTSWRQAWTDLQSMRRNRDATLTEHVGGTDLYCSIDYFRMAQVFRNLFENSLAATRDPVRIEIKTSDDTSNGAPVLRVTVRDNGPGLTKEQKEKVFEPFFSTKPKGTGLGMAIARRFVEAHGGRIIVGDEQGPGAQFVLSLPKHSANEAADS